MPPGALAGHGLALLLCAALGAWLGREPGRARVGALLAIVLLGLQLLLLNAPERVANALPSPAWVWVVDWSSSLCVLLVATAVSASVPIEGEERPSRWALARRVVLGLILVGLTFRASPLPWGGGAEPSPGSWVDRKVPARPIVRQSADASCAAAAGATLLRERGIAPVASEAWLAELCWTDPKRGTNPLGLWRGLSVAAGRNARYTWPSLRELRGPCLVRVGLSERVRDPELRRVLEQECGWPPGESHAVVFYGIEPGRPGEDREVALIGDPRIGFERWSITHFEALWHGVALELR